MAIRVTYKVINKTEPFSHMYDSATTFKIVDGSLIVQSPANMYLGIYAPGTWLSAVTESEVSK
ncbi:hypothetical protein A5N78_04580 [Prescottella equi]|nr:hypothetical protein A5N78_04580 [Prescottella equi]ORM17769.1 hypothetical protein A5N70_11155 [Prescottella equi]